MVVETQVGTNRNNPLAWVTFLGNVAYTYTDTTKYTDDIISHHMEREREREEREEGEREREKREGERGEGKRGE